MDRREQDRRLGGPDRRGFRYSKHIPEFRSGNDRRIYWGKRRTGMTERRINPFYPHDPERRKHTNASVYLQGNGKQEY